MVLVTGATGILGSMIVLQLLQKGVEVLAAKRPNSDIGAVLHTFSLYTDQAQELFDKIQWTDLDLGDILGLQNVLENVTEVFHCAAMVSMNPYYKKEMYETNIVGTKNILYACENSSVQKFCFISSVATLDGLNANGEYDEESHYKSSLPHSAYAKSKHFAEMEVWRAGAEGLNIVIVLPAIILASGTRNSSSGVLFKSLEKNKFTFSGGANYVDVRDVSKMCIELMEKNIFNERFIAVSGTETYYNFSNKVRTKMGKSKPKILPDALLNFSRVFSVFGFLIPALKMLNKANIEAVTTNHGMSNEKIKSALHFDFIPITESIDFHLNNYFKDKKK